ncbi:cysteine proteinase inhibitor 5-like [Bidens hawaiensis]|uniref:cysteine proteinase inhibitor 5-like n=1 Tax=Bidens hawaiensis TaxID=980011 RepID=UPI004049AA7F
MPTNFHFLLFIILILLPDSIFLKISLASEGDTLVSDWRPIKNLSDTKVVDVGKFAVARHNFEAMSRLFFDELVYGEMKSRTGTDYNLTIAARDDGNTDDDNEPRNYVAIVSDRQFQDFMHLVSFRGPV